MDCANTKEIGTGESSPPLEEARRPSEIRIRGLEGRLERTGSQVEIGEGGEVKVIKLMPTTKENMTKLMGMNNLKNKINGIAAEVLPEGVLNQEKFVSFKDASEQESEAKNLTELYAEAGKVLPVFAETMRGLWRGWGWARTSIQRSRVRGSWTTGSSLRL